MKIITIHSPTGTQYLIHTRALLTVVMKVKKNLRGKPAY
jgi:hypothetical protein